MTEQYQPAAPAPQAPPVPLRRGRFRRALFIVAIVLAAGFTGAVATQAMNGGFGPPWHGRGFMGAMEPGFIEHRADRMVRHLAIEIDASAEQQDKLRAVMQAAVRDLMPMREKAWTARREARRLLTQSTIDRDAIEKFRAEQVALADAFSKRVAQALADAAEVLTPEQRRRVEEFLEYRRGYGRRWHRE